MRTHKNANWEEALLGRPLHSALPNTLPPELRFWKANCLQDQQKLSELLLFTFWCSFPLLSSSLPSFLPSYLPSFFPPLVLPSSSLPTFPPSLPPSFLLSISPFLAFLHARTPLPGIHCLLLVLCLLKFHLAPALFVALLLLRLGGRVLQLASAGGRKGVAARLW